MSTLERTVPARYRSQLGMLRDGDPNCVPTVSGDTLDTDGDGIENNATYTFTSANCFYTDSTGDGFALTGSVSIADTDGGATLFGFAIDYNNLKILIYADSNSLGYDWDGTYDAAVTATDVSTNQQFRARLRVNDNPVYAARYNWALVFTPDSGTIDPATQQLLPDGTFDVTGGYGWSGQYGNADGNWSFNISTPTALHWNAACEAFDPPFDGGQLRASINGRNNIGFTVDYGPNCGDTAVNSFDNTSGT
jgi:hypothetical protein